MPMPRSTDWRNAESVFSGTPAARPRWATIVTGGRWDGAGAAVASAMIANPEAIVRTLPILPCQFNSTNWLTFKFETTIFNHMVKHDSQQLDIVFHALGDATRRGMLASLALGKRSIGELAEPFAMSFAGASKHVKVLEDAGLVSRDIRGRTHICSLEAAPLAGVTEWLRTYEIFWTGRLDALEQLLREDDVRKSKTAKNDKKGE